MVVVGMINFGVVLRKSFILSFLLVFAVMQGQTQIKTDEAYLFSYFTNNGEDGLHLAYSLDGYQFTALNNDKPFLAPTIGEQKIMRDPCIIAGPDKKFHLVWTVSWKGKGIGYSCSSDLINWEKPRYVPVMQNEPETMNCWAPELFYDEQQKQYLIYWSSAIPGRYAATDSTEDNGSNHRIYCTTTKDFETFSETKLFFNQGFNVIDATIQKVGNQFVMFVKNETQYPVAEKNIRVCFSNNLYQDYSAASPAITRNWVEGPSVVSTEKGWMLYFDIYREHKMGAVFSSDLKNWEDVSSKIKFPEGTKHGSVFKVNRKLLDQLKKNE